MTGEVEALTAHESSISKWLEDCRVWAERELEGLMPAGDAHPARLHEAMRYSLFGGGKRLRPAVVRTVCAALGGSDHEARVPAAALEIVHTYSLVHDDLPCMDDDDLRRGRPTCHVAYDEATAVLVGDALLTLAFEWLGYSGGPRAAQLSGVLARAAGSVGMVGGQVLDLNAEGAAQGLEEVLDLHGRKTAALFGAAAEMGAVAAGAPDEARRGARAWGIALGHCFQATDDVLDVTGDAATLGKTPGKDDALDRNTLVGALGLQAARRKAAELAESARQQARRQGWGEGHHAFELIDAVLARRA